MTAPLCFIDTETTGLHTDRQVWDIAMIRRETSGRQDEISFCVDVDLAKADPFGLAIGRFYERHPLGQYLAGLAGGDDEYSERLSRSQAAEEVARWTHGAHIVGSVPNFDTETLAPLLRAHGLMPAWHYHVIDVETLAVGYLHGVAARAIDEALMRGEEPPPVDRAKAAPPWKSDEISRAVGVEPPSDDERHTALGDAKWAMRIYDAITTGHTRA